MAGGAAGAGFEVVADGDEGQQAGGFHEVEVGKRAPGVEFVAGEGDQAVEVGDGDAHRDEGVHIGGAAEECGPGAAVERDADVDDRDGGGDEGEADEGFAVGPGVVAGEHGDPVDEFDGEPEDSGDGGSLEPARVWRACSCMRWDSESALGADCSTAAG